MAEGENMAWRSRKAGWAGPWPGRGPFSHLPPWKRPGWLFGKGWCCWALAGSRLLPWWARPPVQWSPEDELAALEDYKRELEEEKASIEEEIRDIEERIRNLRASEKGGEKP